MFEPFSFPFEYIVDLLKEIIIVIILAIFHILNHGE